MSVEKTALLPVSADEAFALVTEPDRLRRWQTVTARVDLRAGGEYRWTVVPGHVAAGTYREVEPGRRVVFGWGWEGSADLGPDASTVTVTLEPAEGGTLVRLVHDGLTDDQAANHADGWSHFLQRLQRAAASGDAGPDEWTAVPAGPTPLTAAESALAVCQRVLLGVGPDRLGDPTPCTEFTVGDLLDHLVVSLRRLGAMAGAEVRDLPSAAAEPRVAFVAQQTLEAWQGRGLEGTVKAGDNEMPATFAASILFLELLIHAWDLASATDQKPEVADELGTYGLERAHEVISPSLRAGGSFADPVEIHAEAPVLDRLVAFSGRTVA